MKVVYCSTLFILPAILSPIARIEGSFSCQCKMEYTGNGTVVHVTKENILRNLLHWKTQKKKNAEDISYPKMLFKLQKK